MESIVIGGVTLVLSLVLYGMEKKTHSGADRRKTKEGQIVGRAERKTDQAF